MSKTRILNVGNMYFNAFRENKIIAKITEFTVLKTIEHKKAILTPANLYFDIYTAQNI